MYKQLVAVWDHKTQCFENPFFCITRGEAVRMFCDVCQDAGSKLNKHPEDFVLFWLGELDTRNGVLTTPDTPEPISKAIEWTVEVPPMDQEIVANA